MKKITILVLAAVAAFAFIKPAGLTIGAMAPDFSLTNTVDGKKVALADYKDAKGYIVVFTCNHCPYAQLYEERIMNLDKKYGKQGYPVIAISPNDPAQAPDDSPEAMKAQAEKMGYTFPYLFDETQETAKAYGATRTPHVYVLTKTKDGNRVDYIGAIDDNYKSAKNVKIHYLDDAMKAILKGEKPATAETKAIGCTIKWSKN